MFRPLSQGHNRLLKIADDVEQIKMDRRDFIKLSSTTIGLSFLGLSSSAQAFLTCTPFDAQGLQQCKAGIDSRIAAIASLGTGGLYMPQWCWAACIEMVFNYHGINISQEDIVARSCGGIEQFPGQPRHILANLSRNWRGSGRTKFLVSGESYSADLATASRDLSQDCPLIIGNRGHTMVLTSMKYEMDKWGNGNVLEAEVVDPWPGRGRRLLSAQEWLSTSFLTCIRVTTNTI